MAGGRWVGVAVPVACCALAAGAFGGGVAIGRSRSHPTKLVAASPASTSAPSTTSSSTTPPTAAVPLTVPLAPTQTLAATTTSTARKAAAYAISPSTKTGAYRLEDPGPADGGIDNPVMRWEREAGAGAPVVLVVGDSLTYGVGKNGKSQLESLQGVTFHVDAQVSRPTKPAPAILARDGVASADYVVIALGTNDAGDKDAYDKRIAEVLAALPARVRRVLWVMPARWTSAMDRIRADLDAASQRDPRLALLDWDAILVQHPEWKSSDGVHLTRTGYAARGQAMADALAPIVNGG